MFIEIVIFFFSTLLSFIINYVTLSRTITQGTLALILLVLLLFTRRKFPFSHTLPIESSWYRFALLFVGSLFVQLLVVATGGFYSTFLIVLHIFALAISFLLNFRSSLIFLIFSVFLLILHVFTNEAIRSIFQDDPWSLALYITSFVVIIPLAYYLMRTYRIQAIVSKSLADYIGVVELREKSILAGLSELIIIADKDLRILSANEAAEQTFNILVDRLIQKNLLDVLVLKNEKGERITREMLCIDEVLRDKTNQTIQGVSLITKTIPSLRVKIQVYPIADLEGIVTQLAFVIRSIKAAGKHQLHSYLEQARMRHKALIENLASSPALRRRVELYSKIEDDLLTALEVEDHPITPIITHEDVVEVCRRVVAAKQNFAKSMGVMLRFNGPEKKPIDSSLVSLYFIPIDAKWLDLLIRKLLDMAILLASKEVNPEAEFTLRQVNHTIEIVIVASSPILSEKNREDLFTQYYGTLGAKTNLIQGSGLEGFIAKTIATQLHIPLAAQIQEGRLAFILHLHT